MLNLVGGIAWMGLVGVGGLGSWVCCCETPSSTNPKELLELDMDELFEPIEGELFSFLVDNEPKRAAQNLDGRVASARRGGIA